MTNPSHHRRSIRLRGYDYAQPGVYFVTFNVHGGEPVLGQVRDGKMAVSRLGRIVQECWVDLPRHYPHVVLDEFIVMPNHVHAIIVLTGTGESPTPGRGGSLFAAESAPQQTPEGRAETRPAEQTRPYVPPAITPTKQIRHGLPEIVRALKSFSARGINRCRGTPSVPVWQRNYFERIVRSQDEWEAVRRYIWHNPLNWGIDHGDGVGGRKQGKP